MADEKSTGRTDTEKVDSSPLVLLDKAAEKKRKVHGSAQRKSLNDIQIPNWVLIAVILLFVLVGALWFFIWGRPKPAITPSGTPDTLQYASEASSDALPIEVLPQITRQFGSGDVKNPFATEVLGPIKVLGTVMNSNGKSTAILSTEDSSYIVSVGDLMPDSTWEITRIDSNSVTFTSNETSRTLFVDGSTNSTEAQ